MEFGNGLTFRRNGWKLIGRKDDEYYFADSVFFHRGDFQGVTGSVVRPVSPGEYEWASDRENVAERLLDVYACMQECTCRHDYSDDPEFEEFVDKAIQYDGIEHIMFDESHCCDASGSFDELGIEHECTDCTGGGRIFGRLGDAPPMEFDEVYDYAALEAIVACEDGRMSADCAARIVFGE